MLHQALLNTINSQLFRFLGIIGEVDNLALESARLLYKLVLRGYCPRELDRRMRVFIFRQAKAVGTSRSGLVREIQKLWHEISHGSHQISQQ